MFQLFDDRFYYSLHSFSKASCHNNFNGRPVSYVALRIKDRSDKSVNMASSNNGEKREELSDELIKFEDVNKVIELFKTIIPQNDVKIRPEGETANLSMGV